MSKICMNLPVIIPPAVVLTPLLWFIAVLKKIKEDIYLEKFKTEIKSVRKLNEAFKFQTTSLCP